jgi:hypothetical protein
MTWSLRYRPSASCTAGSAAIGVTVETQRPVLSALRRAHTPVAAMVNISDVVTTSATATTRRIRWRLRRSAAACSADICARRPPTSSSSRACSAFSRSTSACSASSMPARLPLGTPLGIAREG